MNDPLLNKVYIVPELDIRRFDNSEEYVVTKKTRKGIIKVIKPEILEKIKNRVE